MSANAPTWRIIEGDCIEQMAAMPAASIDAIVTDPPYGLGFMGREWDALPPGLPWAQECLRVLKPGGHLLAFGGTRTYHRLTCAIEDAGFEIRDCLAWLYGSGFPKSLDVSKAIDKAAGAEREVIGDKLDRPGYHLHGHDGGEAFGHGLSSSTHETRLASALLTAPATPDAERWQGWGTALKPAHEPIVMARKPLAGTAAANVLAHGTGALNVDGCRIVGDMTGANYGGRQEASIGYGGTDADGSFRTEQHGGGRWPANVVLDEQAAAMLDEQTGDLHSQDPETRNRGRKPEWSPSGTARKVIEKSNPNGADKGGASRFFYCAKADTAERNVGLEGFEPLKREGTSGVDRPMRRCVECERLKGGAGGNCQCGPTAVVEVPLAARRNVHPTVKPVELMRWLCRLVTPPGGTVLDPFTGSGTTGIAAMREGFAFIGIEREPEYVQIARARIVGDAPLLNSVAEAA